MKKILIFIDWYEPGYKAGGPIRSVKNLVDQLKGEAKFFIFTRDRDYQSEEPYKDLQVGQWIDIEQNVQVYYCPPEKLNKETLLKILQTEFFDTVYINGIYSWYFSIFPLLLMKNKVNANTVVAARGMLARSAIGVKSWKKNVFLRLANIAGLYHNAKFHATSKGEEKDIREQLGEGVKVVVASNLPASLPNSNSQKMPAVKAVGEVRLVSIARISPEKNTLFSIQALQACSSSISLSLDIYGPVYNEEYWKQCQQAISALGNNVKVSYKGNLPNEEVPNTLTQYHFFYLPSRGENFGHSILEAFSAGVPVIISDQTPWRGLEEKGIGFDLPLQEKVLFKVAFEKVAGMEPEEYKKWSEAAYTFAKDVREDPTALMAYREMFGLV